MSLLLLFVHSFDEGPQQPTLGRYYESWLQQVYKNHYLNIKKYNNQMLLPCKTIKNQHICNFIKRRSIQGINLLNISFKVLTIMPQQHVWKSDFICVENICSCIFFILFGTTYRNFELLLFGRSFDLDNNKKLKKHPII